MRIRLNGNMNFNDGITFDNLNIELLDYNPVDEYLDGYNIGDYDELVTLDEYLDEMINDYAEIIAYEDIELQDILTAMAYELLALWLGIDININSDFD